jgi:hypothetical protein
MRKLHKPSPAESPMLFEIDPEPAPETLPALGGIPLLVQAFRSLGLPARVKRHVQVKQRERGLHEASLVESFVILNAAGGEFVEDFDRLREDPGLAEPIRHGIPSPGPVRNFLYEFHDEAKITGAQQQVPPGQLAYIPGENEALQGLARANGDLVAALGQRCTKQKIATVDQDVTTTESPFPRSRRVLTCYESRYRRIGANHMVLTKGSNTLIVLSRRVRSGGALGIVWHTEP